MTLREKLLARKIELATGQSIKPLDLTEQHQIYQSLPTDIKVLMAKKPIDHRLEAYVTNDPACKQLLRQARLCAFRPDPVLIQGETGTGKELLARVMLGDRAGHEFFPVNCAGIVETLFESLVFGHVKGSFTGAVVDKPGLLVSAKTGVVFFDEIGELPVSQQSKLLRALQERKVMAVGSVLEVPIQCRLVFATNRDLGEEVKQGRFREDLYYRISALTLKTIPLRERPDDAIIIANAICAAREWSYPEVSIPDSVIASPGNVRALENWLLNNEVFGTTE